MRILQIYLFYVIWEIIVLVNIYIYIHFKFDFFIITYADKYCCDVILILIHENDCIHLVEQNSLTLWPFQIIKRLKNIMIFLSFFVAILPRPLC